MRATHATARDLNRAWLVFELFDEVVHDASTREHESRRAKRRREVSAAQRAADDKASGAQVICAQAVGANSAPGVR